MIWTKEKEARYLSLTNTYTETSCASEDEVSVINGLHVLRIERNEWIASQLEKQGETRERLPNDKEFLQLASEQVSARLPDGWGYILFVFPFAGGRMGYTSNAERKSAIAALKTWLLKQSPENWLKHVD